jgi:hypothetical protein
VPTRKQRRRREKLKRHEWEEVYVDDEGRELDPDEAEALAAAAPAAKAVRKTASTTGSRRERRPIEPPSLRRTLRRGLLFFPLMVLVIFVLPGDASATTATKIFQAVVLLAFFLPFSYFMDVFVWRSYQRRLAKQAAAGPAPKKR